MQNVMMIENISYALYETTAPTFVLKSEVVEALGKGEMVTCVNPKESMYFNGKYYGYVKLNPKKDGEAILQTDNGDLGQQQ